MFCSKCGAEIPEGAQWCPQCGVKLNDAPTPVVQPQPVPQPAPKPARPQVPGGLVGFILAVSGASFFWVPFMGLGLSIAGTVICGKGKKHMENYPADYANKGFVKAGSITGLCGIIASAIFMTIWIIAILIDADIFY